MNYDQCEYCEDPDASYCFDTGLRLCDECALLLPFDELDDVDLSTPWEMER